LVCFLSKHILGHRALRDLPSHRAPAPATTGTHFKPSRSPEHPLHTPQEQNSFQHLLTLTGTPRQTLTSAAYGGMATQPHAGHTQVQVSLAECILAFFSRINPAVVIQITCFERMASRFSPRWDIRYMDSLLLSHSAPLSPRNSVTVSLQFKGKSSSK